MADRNEILELLISSEKLLDIHFVDQRKYLERRSKTLGLGIEQDARYCWIFRNLDYEKWVQRGGEAKILGLHSPYTEDLEIAASHIVRSLRSAAGQEGEVLYFFYNSTRRERGPQGVVGWRDLLCVWSLMRQLIEVHSTAGESLLKAFLRSALDFLGDELAKLRVHSDPTEVLRSLFYLSKPQDLWDAFTQALGDLGELANLRKQNLTLIIDLNSMASAWEGLVDNIRKMTAGLPQSCGAVRVLLSNLPEVSDLGQHRPSEVLLQHDKEGKGMYSVHDLDTLS